MTQQRSRLRTNQTQLQLSLTTTTTATAVIDDAILILDPAPPPPPPMMRNDIVVVITPTGSPVHKKQKFVRPAASTIRRKQVVFGPNIIYRIETIEELTTEEKDACWYLPSELEAMKQAAKYLFRKRLFPDDDREEQTTTPRIDNDTQIKCDDNDDEDSLRGMGTYHPVRVRYSKKYCQKVVEAYRKMRHHVQRVQSPSFLAEEMENGAAVAVVAAVAAWNGEAHIAALATRWSIKNVQRALTRGRNDYNIVYGS